MTGTGEWRRQFPIHFRTLEQKFHRWQWIDYEWRKPKDDNRPESRRVQEHTIIAGTKVRERERAGFLDPIIVSSTEVAAAKGHTLALARPRNVRFCYEKKQAVAIEQERQAYASVARQGSFFDEALTALEPCPYAFRLEYETEDGKPHGNVCDDWETAAMFSKFQRQYGEARTLELMDKAFNHDYPSKGMALALGTHSRYPGSRLLVGVIRLGRVSQMTLGL